MLLAHAFAPCRVTQREFAPHVTPPRLLPIPVLLGHSGVCKPRKSMLGRDYSPAPAAPPSPRPLPSLPACAHALLFPEQQIPPAGPPARACWYAVLLLKALELVRACCAKLGSPAAPLSSWRGCQSFARGGRRSAVSYGCVDFRNTFESLDYRNSLRFDRVAPDTVSDQRHGEVTARHSRYFSKQHVLGNQFLRRASQTQGLPTVCW